MRETPLQLTTACFEDKYFVLHFLEKKKKKLDVTSVVPATGYWSCYKAKGTVSSYLPFKEPLVF